MGFIIFLIWKRIYSFLRALDWKRVFNFHESRKIIPLYPIHVFDCTISKKISRIPHYRRVWFNVGEGGGHGVKNIVYKYLGDEEIPHQIYIFVLLCIKHILTHLPYIFEVIFLLHKRSFYYSLDSNHSMFIMILYYIM